MSDGAADASNESAAVVGRWEFMLRSAIAAAIAAAVLAILSLLWYARQLLLVTFAGIVLAVFLRSLADRVSRRTGIRYGWSLAIVLLMLTALLALGGWLVGAQVIAQLTQLSEKIPAALAELRDRVEGTPWGSWLLDRAPQPEQVVSRDGSISELTGIASSVLSFIGAVAVILFVGIYVAAEPRLYKKGLLRLVPPLRRARADEVMTALGYTLRWWLAARLASMVIVGASTTLGLWLLDVPLALALGLLAFGLVIIPNIGPVLSALPAVLLAAADGPMRAVYVVALYCGIQVIESYALDPLLERKTVWLPPMLSLISVVLFGLIGGLPGVLVASPLTVCLMVLVKMLYVEDTLGDRSIEVPGEPPR